MNSKERTQIAFLCNALVNVKDVKQIFQIAKEEESVSLPIIEVVEEIEKLFDKGYDWKRIAKKFLRRKDPFFYAGQALLGSLESLKWLRSQQV